jgi:hypothetical protein
MNGRALVQRAARLRAPLTDVPAQVGTVRLQSGRGQPAGAAPNSCNAWFFPPAAAAYFAAPVSSQIAKYW